LILALFVYLDFFADYFTSFSTILGIAAAALAMIGGYAVFRGSRNSSIRTYSLIGTMAVSSFLWLFVISSLVLCALMAEQYWAAPQPTIARVVQLSLLITLTGGPSLILLFRGRAIDRVYKLIQKSTIPFHEASNREKQARPLMEQSDAILPIYERSLRIFSDLKRQTTVISPPVSLSLMKGDGEARLLPESIAMDWHNQKLVAIKENVVTMLEDDELEGVLAHELGHLKQKDARAKSIATAFRIAFPFDPVVYFGEAAIYRERELAADAFSARLTGRPASLASALLKIYKVMRENASSGLKAPFAVSFLMSNSSGEAASKKTKIKSRGALLSKEPTLTLRIERLLEITNSMTLQAHNGK
jgi:Zn-dependent protease with chaperone function